jgi:ABC-type Na+ efflux pump permease subunit
MSMDATEIPAEGCAVSPPGTVRMTWLIGRRAALESLRDRPTLYLSLIASLILPIVFVIGGIQSQTAHLDGVKARADLGATLASYLLVVALGPASGAISIAAGVFAGELEKGNLLPLLATPASNVAIFAGKVLGAVMPACLYIAIAEVMYILYNLALIGQDNLRLMPISLTAAILLLVPATAVMGAGVAALISSRVRTYTGAQTAASLATIPVMGVLVAVAFSMRSWGPWWPFGAVAVVIAADALLIVRGAATWKREEVLARQ